MFLESNINLGNTRETNTAPAQCHVGDACSVGTTTSKVLPGGYEIEKKQLFIIIKKMMCLVGLVVHRPKLGL